MSQSMLSRLADISSPKPVTSLSVYTENYKVYRLDFDGDLSNIFVFKPLSRSGIEKIIDLDTGNGLFPNNKGSSYMVYTSDYRILGPFIYRLFICDDKKKLTYEPHVKFTKYTSPTPMYDFSIGENILSYGMGPNPNDVLFIKLKHQPKRLICSNQGAWRLEEAAVA